MTKPTTFRNGALAVLALLALAACNRDWDSNRAAPVGAGSAETSNVPAHDAKGMAAGAGAQGLQTGAAGDRHAFAALPDRGDLVEYPQERVVRRYGAYTWHRADVSEEHALRAIVGGELRITAPDGQLLAFEYERHVEHETGDWTWIGRLRDAPPGRQAILTFGADAVFGNIAQTAAAPLRLAMRDGAAWLVETDQALLAGVESRVLRPDAPDFLLPPTYTGSASGPKSSGDTTNSSESPVVSSSSAINSTTTVVDVLVGYTSGFAAAQGGDSQARTRINFLIEVGNQGFVNSQIDGRVRLVHAMQVNYTDATDNAGTLEKLTGYKSGSGFTTPDPTFSALRNARETYGADLVTLVRKFSTPENDGCGIAWLIGGGLTNITQNFEYFGYSVVSDGIDVDEQDNKTYYCRDETMVHEFGHNMGSAHDLQTAMGDDGVLQTSEYGRYTYSFGYKTAPGSGDFYTIMAYGDKRDSAPYQHPYRVFSNPNITYCGGFACGTSNADNARSLRQTMPVIASFRATVAPVAAARNDVNGDGKSDLFWFNSAQRLLGYWLMNGATVGSQKSFSAGSGYVPVATGDFNGDGKSDVIWTSAARDLYMWTGNGSTFVSQYFGSYPAGWSPVGAGDIDGDGKADLLWFNAGTRQFGYWLMNGTAIGTQRSFVAGAGYSPVAVGDFNGDGKLDIVWTSAARDLYMWVGNGVTFTSTKFWGSYPSGWQIVGAGDVNGDGKSDLLLFNSSMALMGYWIMNGTAVGLQKSFSSGAGYVPRAAGDYNGDGKLDLVFAGAARDLRMWQGDGVNFSSTTFGSFPAGWAIAPEKWGMSFAGR